MQEDLAFGMASFQGKQHAQGNAGGSLYISSVISKWAHIFTNQCRESNSGRNHLGHRTALTKETFSLLCFLAELMVIWLS